MTTTVTVTFDATFNTAILPANRMAVAVAVFNRLARETEHPAGISGLDQLHITTNTDDADILDALDDALRSRAQTVGEFDGAECFVLCPGEGIDRCAVWARCKVTAESAFVVEGCGADQTITATTADAAAQEAADWQHGGDGAHTVMLTWRDAGSDSTTIAVYDCEVDGESVGRVVVRAA
jgi:hypothetical protein